MTALVSKPHRTHHNQDDVPRRNVLCPLGPLVSFFGICQLFFLSTKRCLDVWMDEARQWIYED